jgi:putative photosynthetic complex assembly protein
MSQSLPLPNAVPRGAILGAGVLIVSSLLLVIGARLAGWTPARPAVSAVIASVDLQFEDRADGAVLVYLEGQADPNQILAPGTNGFVRGVLRGLARERRAESISSRAPFRLTRWADGRLSLDDPATGRHVDLEVFGPTNAGAFAEIFNNSTRAKGAT